jgi:hypothetical protein
VVELGVVELGLVELGVDAVVVEPLAVELGLDSAGVARSWLVHPAAAPSTSRTVAPRAAAALLGGGG